MPAAVDPTPASPADKPASPVPRSADGEQIPFRERLLPGPGTWLVVVALGAILGVVLVPLNAPLAIVVGIISILIAIVLAVLYSPVLEVADGKFSLGRARIDVQLLGEPAVLRGEDWQITMGQGFEPLAHHCTRAWVHSGIRVEVLDTEDPTTAWVASSRRPEDLALAVRAAQRNA